MVEEDGWRPTEEEVRRIAERVLEILEYLHGFVPAIVHRDIKPEVCPYLFVGMYVFCVCVCVRVLFILPSAALTS